MCHEGSFAERKTTKKDSPLGQILISFESCVYNIGTRTSRVMCFCNVRDASKIVDFFFEMGVQFYIQYMRY